jgi:hypothetical protein
MLGCGRTGAGAVIRCREAQTIAGEQPGCQQSKGGEAASYWLCIGGGAQAAQPPQEEYAYRSVYQLRELRGGLLHAGICLPFDKLRTNGSKVLTHFLFFVFALAEREDEER